MRYHILYIIYYILYIKALPHHLLGALGCLLFSFLFFLFPFSILFTVPLVKECLLLGGEKVANALAGGILDDLELRAWLSAEVLILKGGLAENSLDFSALVVGKSNEVCHLLELVGRHNCGLARHQILPRRPDNHAEEKCRDDDQLGFAFI